MLCAYASHVLSIDWAGKELEGMIVQTESIPSSPGTIFPRTSSKPQSQKSCQFSCKSHEQEKLKLIWCICSELYKLYFSLNSNRDEYADRWAQGLWLKTWFSVWSQWDWFGELRLWLKNSRHYNTRPLPPLLNHHQPPTTPCITITPRVALLCKFSFTVFSFSFQGILTTIVPSIEF